MGPSLHKNKEGLSFHRTFPLSRDMLRQVLKLAFERGAVDGASLKTLTTLGTVQVESAPNYATSTGLLHQDRSITPLGRLIHRADPGMARPATQWLLHYHISSPHGCGPAFWNHLITTAFRPGNTLKRQEVVESLDRFVSETEGRKISPRTLEAAASVVLSTYSQPDGLGALGFLEGNAGVYVLGQPLEPSPRVFAYVLADFWEQVWGDAPTVNLARVTGAEGPAALLLLGSGATGRLLRQLQAEGLLEVHRRAPPYQVARLWPRAADLLDAVYAE